MLTLAGDDDEPASANGANAATLVMIAGGIFIAPFFNVLVVLPRILKKIEGKVWMAGFASFAIPAVIGYNLFVNRVRLFAGELEGFANELIGTMAREGLV